jgi:hypothetical protein
MAGNTIDTAMAKRLVEATAIVGAAIIGQPGGWSVMLKLGTVERPLATQRTGKLRLWRSLDRCIDYLKHELHIARVDLLDATDFEPVATGGHARVDTAERMRRTHEAAVHDKWFREQVEQALAEAGATVADLRATVSTGYGRQNVAFATSSATEIHCHGLGCHHDKHRVLRGHRPPGQ